MDAGSARRRLTALANHTRDGPAASSALPPLRYRCLVQDPVDGPSATPGGRRWFCPHAATGNYEGGFDAADADVDAIAAAVHEDGYAVVRGGLPVSFVEECAVAFAFRLESHEDRRERPEDAQQRALSPLHRPSRRAAVRAGRFCTAGRSDRPPTARPTRRG